MFVRRGQRIYHNFYGKWTCAGVHSKMQNIVGIDFAHAGRFLLGFPIHLKLSCNNTNDNMFLTESGREESGI